ncbi:hypothetical protein ACWIB8_05155 [Corynebacterium flavescens]
MHDVKMNQFLKQWLVGEDWAACALDAGNRAAALWQGIVAKDTGTLARSVQVTLGVHSGKPHTSLYAIVTSTADYAAPHEFGNEHVGVPGREWHQVLSMLGG